MSSTLRAGDLVMVKASEEIISTLNENGTLEGLPFMPEMLKYCGKQFKVYQRVLQSVIDTAGLSDYAEAHVRSFTGISVFTLINLRCSGKDYGNCQRGCKLFWKEAWLKKINNSDEKDIFDNNNIIEIKHKLKTLDDSGRYFCQSTQYYNSTKNISKSQRFINLPLNIWYGNYNLIALVRLLSIWSFWKFFTKFFGDYPKGNLKKTPDETLNLQPGELVEVKSLKEITKTLNKSGRNRGLHFSPDMIKYCGKKYKVRNRTDKIIFEATGEMQNLTNTVMLEGVFADSAYYAFGGCPREDFAYWREIWLKRVN